MTPETPSATSIEVNHMKYTRMHIAAPSAALVANEADIIDQLLSLQGARVLELGCGKADKTRIVARKAAAVMALEVDETQLAKNLAGNDLDNVIFAHGGAEKIPADAASVDIVLMFKSLHHVPMELMDSACAEIHRVVKPGGVAYISEPVYAGDFNEVLKLFHDEKIVREAAFSAVQRAVSSGLLELVTQTFFLQEMHFSDFTQYQDQVLNVTHTDHNLSAEVLAAVRAKFNQYITDTGATFHMPIRVDLLRKSAEAGS